MTMLTGFETGAEKQSLWTADQLYGIGEKTPQEAHESITKVLCIQHRHIQKLIDDGRALRTPIQECEIKLNKLSANQHGSTQTIMRRMWDNKEDEFWDTL